MFYSDSNIFHLRICPYYRSYILPVLIFKALHFYHVHNYGSSPTFVSIFMGTVYTWMEMQYVSRGSGIFADPKASDVRFQLI